jgi:hypothetical protein
MSLVARAPMGGRVASSASLRRTLGARTAASPRSRPTTRVRLIGGRVVRSSDAGVHRESRCKTPNFHRKPESLYHRDSPWISGYRVQNVSQINTQSHTSHHIRVKVHNYYMSIMEYVITSLLAELE